MSLPVAALAASRVDLVERIRAGIPEPAHVPGCAPWLRAGKRYLIPAPAGSGKTLAMPTVAVTVIEHGGSVVILDVENGGDEYAGRLDDILSARDRDGALAEGCRQRLHYHDWPRLSLGWQPDEWADAIGGADLVIFDSSRLALSSVGLAEDSADDYSRFVAALVVPLARAGATTVILDNTGHNGDRARGTSAKDDLNEVVYLLKRGVPFDRDQAGHVRLVRDRERFSGLPRELHVRLGGGVYDAPVIVEATAATGDDFRPTGLMVKCSRVIAASPGLSRNAIMAKVKGKREYVLLALEHLVADGFVRIEPGPNRSNRHYSKQPYSEPDESGWTAPGSGDT